MSELLDQTVRNNAEWCSLICASHGGDSGRFEFASWIIKGHAPPYYPNMITLRSGCAIAQAEQAARFTELQGIGVKDSFLELDLAHLGFRSAIQGQWVSYRHTRSEYRLDWRIADTIQELNLWEKTWGGEAHVGQGRTFLPAILDAPTVRMIGGYHDGKLVAGGIVSHAAGVAGLSNVFVTDGYRDAEVAVLSEAHRVADGAQIVGWTREVDPQVAESLGPLQVWLRDGSANVTRHLASTSRRH